MPTSCYCCHAGHKKIPNTILGDVLGSCENCSILACAAHAQRDASYPRWICVLCDTSLLAAASLAHQSRPITLAHAFVSPWVFQQALHYHTLDDFLQRRPKHAWLKNAVLETVGAASERFRTPQTESLWFGLSEEGQRLMGAALTIILKLRIQRADIVLPLGVLLDAWQGRSGPDR